MNDVSAREEITRLHSEIYERVEQLEALHAQAEPEPVANYRFRDQSGEVSLLELFGEKTILFAIHNMGQGCRYCTLWADGLNGFLPHLEESFAVVMLSKDPPDLQRRFALSRQWRFRMASHGGGDYISEQTVSAQYGNAPGIVCYERQGEKILRRNSSEFGPRDLFCPQWHILSLAGIGAEAWTPQFNYWKRPEKLDDGGENVL